MSFDIDILTQDVDGNRIEHEVVCGHTYNLTPMWYKALPGITSVIELSGRNCGELLPDLMAGLARIVEEPEEFRKLNPANGWGDFEGFFEIFVRFASMCRMHPSGTVICDG